MSKIICAIFILITLCSVGFASYPQSYSIRNRSGQYVGRFQTYGNRTNIYNSSGSYQGRFEQRRGYTNQYNRSGQFSGRITPSLRLGR